MITIKGAPAASSCEATICAAPLNMIADMASAATGETPAASAPMPHTMPNGTMPISTGVTSRMPSKNAGREKCRRIRENGCKRKGEARHLPGCGDYKPRSAFDASRGQTSDDALLEHRDQQRDRH